MKSKSSTLGFLLILTGLIFTGCGPTTEPPTEVPTATPTEVAAEAPEEIRAARDAALAYIIEHYAEQAPAPDLTWERGRTTPEGLVGSEIFQCTAEDWVVTTSYPVVALEEVIYQIVVENPTTGFRWKGEVDAAQQVTQLEVAEGGGIPSPASEYCVDQGYRLEIRSDESGGQYGVCIFPDGSECEEWEFFREECTHQQE